MSGGIESVDEIVRGNFAKLATGAGAGAPNQMMGILVGVVTSTGPFYFKFGDVPLYSGGAVATEDVAMFIGSNTKVITATLLALSQFDATNIAITLDTPAGYLLPSGVTLKVCDQCPNQDCPIEFWHLATHSAGFPDALCGQVTFGDYQFDQLGNFLKIFEPSYAPGATWNYSDLGFALLSVLMSHVYTPKSASVGTDPWDATYRNWHAIAEENILKPLGMRSTQVGYLSVLDRIAQPFTYYRSDGGAGYTPIEPPNFMPGTAGLGAGSLSSTLRDMTAFLQNQIAPNRDTTLGQAISFSQLPQAQGALSMGLGWQMGNDFFYKNGLLPGYASFMLFDPVNCFAIVAMANCLGNHGGSLAYASLQTLSEVRGYIATPGCLPQADPKPTCPGSCS